MAISYRSTGALVQAVKLARANPRARFDVPGHFPISATEVLQNFAQGVMRRCNRGLKLGNHRRYLDLVHDARIINDWKQRVRWSGRNLLNDQRMARRYPQVHNPPALDD